MNRFALIGMLAAVMLVACGCAVDKMRTEAISEFQVGHVKHSEELFQQVLGRRPWDAQSLYYMGRICHSRGEYEMAIAYYQQALDSDPSLTDAHKWLEKAVERAGPVGEKLLIIKP